MKAVKRKCKQLDGLQLPDSLNGTARKWVRYDRVGRGLAVGGLWASSLLSLTVLIVPSVSLVLCDLMTCFRVAISVAAGFVGTMALVVSMSRFTDCVDKAKRDTALSLCRNSANTEKSGTLSWALNKIVLERKWTAGAMSALMTAMMPDWLQRVSMISMLDGDLPDGQPEQVRGESASFVRGVSSTLRGLDVAGDSPGIPHYELDYELDEEIVDAVIKAFDFVHSLPASDEEPSDESIAAVIGTLDSITEIDGHPFWDVVHTARKADLERKREAKAGAERREREERLAARAAERKRVEASIRAAVDTANVRDEWSRSDEARNILRQRHRLESLAASRTGQEQTTGNDSSASM